MERFPDSNAKADKRARVSGLSLRISWKQEQMDHKLSITTGLRSEKGEMKEQCNNNGFKNEIAERRDHRDRPSWALHFRRANHKA
jgi:hypothetical protein